ncbi:hypothetical protein B2K_30650 [Paenibacillus mucilaginosus K02]|uniref:Uncharacterized protein n=1 Tax=Paenibacillus mucilaginosus K02 TaxID=997761 RepID=I0BRL7_9BACL|nr:hypothetical protein B2K_30650 [Paenibacillus mucilaginosus K02]
MQEQAEPSVRGAVRFFLLKTMETDNGGGGKHRILSYPASTYGIEVKSDIMGKSCRAAGSHGGWQKRRPEG